MRTYRLLGFALTELLIALIIVGLLTCIAVPSLSRLVHATRTRATLERLAASIHVARTYAIRTGDRVQITFDWDDSQSCVRRYTVHELDGEQRILATVDVTAALPTGCLSMTNASRPLIFNSRGLPHGVMARTLVVQSGEAVDSLVMSQLGRLLRVY
jgi:Tfp pilus assembly protein FimT